MVNKYLKRCLMFLVMREIKIVLSFYFILDKMIVLRIGLLINVRKNVVERGVFMFF